VPAEGKEETPAPVEKPRKAVRPGGDTSRLKFRSTVSDEELQRDREKYDSELWKDL
jgi:hypothetical protein